MKRDASCSLWKHLFHWLVIKLAVKDIILKHSNFLISLWPEVSEKDMMPKSSEKGLPLLVLLILLFNKYTHFLRIIHAGWALRKSSNNPCSVQKKITIHYFCFIFATNILFLLKIKNPLALLWGSRSLKAWLEPSANPIHAPQSRIA